MSMITAVKHLDDCHHRYCSPLVLPERGTFCSDTSEHLPTFDLHYYEAELSCGHRAQIVTGGARPKKGEMFPCFTCAGVIIKVSAPLSKG